MSWAVVVPTNRPERFVQFLDAWHPLFEDHSVRLIVVQDLDGHNREIDIALADYRGRAELHHRGTITAKHIPHGTDMIRSWGIYRAWARDDATFTLSLDDDTEPDCDVFREYEQVFHRGAVLSDYLDVGALTSFDGQLRGFPFRDRKLREVAVQYGGWNGVLDYDAPTQLAGVKSQERFQPVVLPVPRGAAVTGCIMNCAWRTKYAPIMWQLPLHEGRFNRFGDIWSGLFQKRTLDAVGAVMVVNGKATVRHERASDPVANLERESPGIPVNEGLWEWLVGLDDLPSGDMLAVYAEVLESAHDHFVDEDRGHASHFDRASSEWLALFQ